MSNDPKRPERDDFKPCVDKGDPEAARRTMRRVQKMAERADLIDAAIDTPDPGGLMAMEPERDDDIVTCEYCGDPRPRVVDGLHCFAQAKAAERDDEMCWNAGKMTVRLAGASRTHRPQSRVALPNSVDTFLSWRSVVRQWRKDGTTKDSARRVRSAAPKTLLHTSSHSSAF